MAGEEEALGTAGDLPLLLPGGALKLSCFAFCGAPQFLFFWSASAIAWHDISLV